MKLSRKTGIVTTAIFLNSIFFAATATGQQKAAQPATQTNPAMQADALYFDAIRARIKGDTKEAEQLLREVIKLKPDAAGAYYDLARLSIAGNRPEEATGHIKKAISLNPDNAYYKAQYAEILAARNLYEESAKVFGEIAEKEKYNRDYLLKSSLLYQRAGKDKEALKAIDRLLKATNEDDDVLMQKQQLLLKMNDVEGAAAVTRKLIENNPKEGRYYALLAEIYSSNKQPEKAAEVYKMAEQMFPDDPEVQLSLSQYYRINKDSAKSEEYAKKAVSNKALDAETQLQLLIGYYQEARTDSAKREETLKLAEDIAQQNANNAQVLAVYGDLLALNGKRDEAVVQYKKALDIDPSAYTVWQNLLYGYTERQHADSLIAVSERALRVFPNQAMLHYLNGIGHLNKKSYSAAIKSVNRAIDIQPEDDTKLLAEMYSTLGDIYNLIKEHSLSDESYDKALKMDPDNPTVLNNYSYYLSVRGLRLNDAEKMSKRSLDIRPGEATFLDTYGWILYKQGKLEKAREYIQKAIDANPTSDGTVWEHLGDIYFKLKDADKAVESWKVAKERGTENNDIDKKIKDRKLYE